MTVRLWTSCVLVWALAAGCKGQQGDQSDERADADPAAAALQVEAQKVSEQNGVMQALVAASSQNTQLVRASATSQIAGSVVSFPPGAFDVDSNVTLGEGHNLATTANVTKLSDAGVKIEAAGRAVLMTFAYDENTLVPFTATIPAPKGQGTMVVLALENVPGGTQDALTFVPSSAFKVSSGFVTFQASSFGDYQAVILTRALTTPQTVSVDEKVTAPNSTQPAAPDTFAVTGPTDALSGARPVVSWDYAALADTYDVALDLQDPNCGQPYKVYQGVTATSQTVDAQTGTTYVCVTAKNAAGTTKQSNPGFKFQADATPPPAPGAPTCTANGTGDSMTCTWPAVTDGANPTAGYVLQIGTKAGGSDTFNGSLAETSKSIPVLNGTTYYAQVASLDTLGNQSAFSASSTPVTTVP